jgi:hypothetical protein
MIASNKKHEKSSQIYVQLNLFQLDRYSDKKRELEKHHISHHELAANTEEEWFALTIDAPYGDCLLEGIKIWETRGTKTQCPKRIFLHTSGRKIRRGVIESLAREYLGETYQPKYGYIIGTGILTEIITMTEPFIEEQTSDEIKLGHWELGRKAWKLNDLERIEPVPAIGCQGTPWSIDNSKLNPNLRKKLEKVWRKQ